MIHAINKFHAKILLQQAGTCKHKQYSHQYSPQLYIHTDTFNHFYMRTSLGLTISKESKSLTISNPYISLLKSLKKPTYIQSGRSLGFTRRRPPRRPPEIAHHRRKKKKKPEKEREQ